jgi:hypothetical protein
MFEIHKEQYNTLKLLRKIIFNELIRVGWISHSTVLSLYDIGCENGICRDLVNEIINDCREESKASLN